MEIKNGFDVIEFIAQGRGTASIYIQPDSAGGQGFFFDLSKKDVSRIIGFLIAAENLQAVEYD